MCCDRFDHHASAEEAPPEGAATSLAGNKPLRSLAAIGAAVLAATAIAAAALVADASQPTYSFTLVARDMAFYLAEGTEPNPPLEVAAEEQVRMTIVNRDTGIDHDLAVESLGVASAAVRGDGSSTTIEFRAPREPGEHEYVCRLHGRMMRGKIVVR